MYLCPLEVGQVLTLGESVMVPEESDQVGTNLQELAREVTGPEVLDKADMDQQVGLVDLALVDRD